MWPPAVGPCNQGAPRPYPRTVSLSLYDTGTRTVREFVPLHPGEVSVYYCGATVQAAPHIGHLRSGLNIDVLRRWLEQSGLAVTMVRNVTDIEDKILAVSAARHRPRAGDDRADAPADRRWPCLPGGRRRLLLGPDLAGVRAAVRPAG